SNMSLRIAIATPTPHDKCETFVKAHMERLDRVVLVLTGASLPEADGEGRWLLGSSKWDLVLATARSILLKQDRRTRLRTRIMKRLRDQRVDVVLAEYGHTAIEMLPCCEALGIPMVSYFLGFDAFDKDILRRTRNYEQLFAGDHGIVTVSSAMRSHLVHMGAKAERVALIACGVDVRGTAIGHPRAAAPIFLAAGRFTEKKAPHLLLAAFKRVMQVRPEAKLVMVGDGPLWESCFHYVKAEGMTGNVELVGRVDHAALGERMAQARAFVQHSIVALNGDSEGMPVAVLEAMCAGMPVVATRHMGIAEAVEHGVSGLLCEEGDVATMAENMIALVDDPARAASMGEAGREHVRAHFDMRQLITDLQRFLEQRATSR
ncbi:MAG TPA: glycosyltransferase, partial [Flavobacteriales bacterium]|nr:glycosyltransferase [Flavobacteriales bacterium]